MRTPRGNNLEKRRLHDQPGRHDANDKVGLQHGKDLPKLPKLTADLISPPFWMKNEQIDQFNTMRDMVLFADVATYGDRIALEMLCTQYVFYLDVNNIVDTEGMTLMVEGKGGVELPKAHPLLGERSRGFTQLRQMMQEFGLTPSARRAVVKRDPDTPDNTEEEGWDDILN